MKRLKENLLMYIVFILDSIVGIVDTIFYVGIPIIGIWIGFNFIGSYGVSWYIVLLLVGSSLELIKKVYYVFSEEM